jgi:hypothetical protein
LRKVDHVAAIYDPNHKRTKSLSAYDARVHGVLAAIATVVAAAFTASLADRWVERRRPHELAWMVSLAMFTVGALGLWLGAAHEWNGFSFRVFYLFGAIANVPWLALGSVLLVTGGRRAHLWLTVLSIVTAFAAGVMVIAPLREPIAPHDLPEGKVVFGVLPRILAAVASGVGATVIVGLALWSAWRLWRTRGSAADAARNRSLGIGNVVIAVGTLLLAASGTLAGRVGKQEAFALTTAIGVAVLFAGFAIATGVVGTAGRRPRDLARDLLASAQ